jgi:putative heme-binding domain-containing protein
LRKSSTAELIAALERPNPWWRFTAQRLLVENQKKDSVPALLKLFAQTLLPPARAHSLWTLQGLDSLSTDLVVRALADSNAGVREQALILAEPRAPTLQSKMMALARDADPMVRFQAALSLGAVPGKEATNALIAILEHDRSDPWTVTAVLSSANGKELDLFSHLAGSQNSNKNTGHETLDVYKRLASLIAAKGDPTDLASCLRLVAEHGGHVDGSQIAMLEGLGEGLARSGRSLDKWWQQPLKELEPSLEAVRKLIRQASQTALDQKQSLEQRQAALRLLAFGQFAQVRETLSALLLPSEPLPLQLAAVRALSSHDDKEVANVLLGASSSSGPAVRREIIEAQFARKDRLITLLKALEDGRIRPADLDPSRREQLKRHADGSIRARADKIFKATSSSDRLKVVAGYRTALTMASDTARGKAVFQRVCASCHRLENVGNEVGPDLLSALRTKTAETLLSDVFDPSKEVDPRFVNYMVTTRDGRSFTGMIAAESANSITLRRAEKAEDTILRNQIDLVAATAKSLMPENLEAQLTRQDFADVVAYLLRVAGVR